MNKDRALYIKEELLSKISHRISGRDADELYKIYSTEINQNRFRTQPCSCTSQPWKEMINETKLFVDGILAAWEQKETKKRPTK